MNLCHLARGALYVAYNVREKGHMMLQLLGHYGGRGFSGMPHGAPFDGPHQAMMGSFHGPGLSGLVIIAAVGIAIWFFATGRHQRLATSATPAPIAVPTVASYARPSDIDPAEEVARQRFARGEIDAEEYATIVSILRGPGR